MASKSDMYALRDGIASEMVITPYRSFKVYHIPCAKCGRTVDRKIYNGDRAYYCDICRNNLKKKKIEMEHELFDMVLSKGEQRFMKAQAKLLKQVNNPESYENAIKIAKSRADYYGSIPEAMVAIELVKLGYAIIPQQKVGRYKVDFAVPKEKIIVEVDGGLYHQKTNLDRDSYIKLCLGLDWEVIHIPAEWVSNDIRRLRKAMETVRKK